MPNPPVKQIPAAALAALQAAGVDDIAIMTCIDKQGNTYHLKGDRVNDKTPTFPISNTDILEITPSTLVKHKGSTCITYVSGGVLITYCW